jgi:hypothetical protein
MINDPIVEEIHKMRQEHAIQFNCDVVAICQAYRESEKQSKLKLVSLPPKKLPNLGNKHDLNYHGT